MGLTLNASYKLMPASSTQPVTAELTFMFMYKNPSNEGDCVPLFSIFQSQLPLWNLPELYYLSIHFHSLLDRWFSKLSCISF